MRRKSTAMRLLFCPTKTAAPFFVAKHPVTKPNLNIIKRHEQNLQEGIEALVEKALATDEVIVVHT